MAHPDTTHDPQGDGCPAGLRLMAFACAQLHEARGLLAHEGEALHAGVHEARKCIRRARSILAIGRHTLGDRARRLDDDLGQLCRGLSPLRDGQALIEALRRLDRDADEALAAQLPVAEDGARHLRDRRLARMLRHDPRLARRQQRLLTLQSRLARLDWRALGEARIAKAMARSERRAVRAGDRARRQPDLDGAWHTYRRRLRRLRQQHTVLCELDIAAPRVDTFLLDRAITLGEAQDNVLLLRHCGPRSCFASELRRRLAKLARIKVHAARLRENDR